MKRSELVDKLIKEGMSERTLVKFTDKQLNNLANRMLGEAITTTADALSKSAALQNLAKKQDIKLVGEEGEVSEELKGKQKNIDKNHNGKIDGQDFKILKGQKKSEAKEDVNEVDMGLTVKGSKSSSSSVFGGAPKKSSSPKKKSTPKKKEEGETEEGEVDESLNGLMLGVIKDKLSKDLGREPENHEIDKAHEDFVNSWKKDNEYKERMKKNPYKPEKRPSPDFNGYNKRKEKKEESKNEKSNVKEWVESLAENNFHSFTSKNEIMELINVKLNESEVHQYGPNVKTGHNGLPEFMTYDAIVGSSPKIAPSKPKVDPGTKPNKPKTPFQPGPKVNPNPKALREDDPKIAPAKPKVNPGTKPNKPKTPFQPGPKVNPNPKATTKGDKK